MSEIYGGSVPIADCTVQLPDIYFPAPHTDRFQMRQISRLPSLSLRNCQQINRSSQYGDSPQIGPVFSMTSLNLCLPWSGLSLCLCPLNAHFISTTIAFPSSSRTAWPGCIDLSLWRKPFQPVTVFTVLFTFPRCTGVPLCPGLFPVGAQGRTVPGPGGWSRTWHLWV